jgi:hypothetical protein
MRDRTTAEIVDLAVQPKPELVIHAGNLPATAEALRDLLAASGKLFSATLQAKHREPKGVSYAPNSGYSAASR